MSFSTWAGSNQPNNSNNISANPNGKNSEDMDISVNLEETLSEIKQVLGDSDDFMVYGFQVFGQHPAVLLYFSDMTDHAVINNTILKPLKYGPRHIDVHNLPHDALMETIMKDTLYHSEGFRKGKFPLLPTTC